MDFTGRPMKGMVFIDPAGLRGEACGSGLTPPQATSAACRPSRPHPSASTVTWQKACERQSGADRHGTAGPAGRRDASGWLTACSRDLEGFQSGLSWRTILAQGSFRVRGGILDDLVQSAASMGPCRVSR